ncbi:type VI secretion system Vgr family protein [Nitratireductor sp. GCM10026969]|uniref:type VI secretion system Vgr family protein n=1 Tax=Nitratireductor sp. GCM10026969 TaxID=3252645 RepID=UPI003607F25C
MSETLVQAERWLTLETPLGADVLVATEVRGVEGMSRLFEFSVSALSSTETIKPNDLLGKSATLSMARPGGERRHVNGIVVAFSGGAVTRSGYRLFQLKIAPTLWCLDRTSDYKVFQDKTAVDIAKSILGEGGVKFQESLQASYEKRDYCVQFGETDLAFVQRLFAEEGIFYFFKHEASNHTMVIGDNANAYADCKQATIEYRQDAEETNDAVYALRFGAHLTDAKWSFRDYDFEVPDTPVDAERKTSLQPAAGKTWEHFKYPGGSLQSADLTRLAGVNIDATDAAFEMASGQSTCASFTPGHRFTLDKHPVDSLNNTRHTITEVQHEAVDRAHFTIRSGMEGKPFYRNSFTCIPATRIARALTPPVKPLARGPQTALVVGPSGDEVHADKYGRIRVQFHWDRIGKKDEKSSCYVHVAQGLAGNSWGMVFIPRIGMEVVVQFLDGDPDRPLVTGTVYNGNNAPPWTQSESSIKSGILTRSTKSGKAANANELSFEDKKDAEKILFHAEKDFLREVENDDTLTVGHDQTRTVKNNRTTTIEEGNETFTIKQGNRAEKIEKGNETLDILEGDRTVTITRGDETLSLKKGNRAVTLDGGNDELTVKQGNQTTTAKLGKITLDAMQGITLKCGSNTIEVTPQGIKINGIQVAVKGTAKADFGAPLVSVSGDGILTLKGGVVKIN